MLGVSSSTRKLLFCVCRADGGECPPVDGEAEPYTSRYRGVSAWQGKWRAYICFKGKNHFLGRFETEEQVCCALETVDTYH